MSIWDVFLGRWWGALTAAPAPPEPAETEEYRAAMAQARAAQQRAQCIMETYGVERNHTSTRPA